MASKTRDSLRCEWVGPDPLYVRYHDEEWGVPVHDDRLLFEMLTLEGAQAGLSWLTVLKKREHYKKVFSDFDASKVARYTPLKAEKLLKDPGIVRNRLKVQSTILNAKAVLEVRREFGTLDRFLWQFVDGKPIVNKFESLSEIPAQTSASKLMSKELLRRGFKFVGPTICYAFMQAVGMVNDHERTCPRWKEV